MIRQRPFVLSMVKLIFDPKRKGDPLPEQYTQQLARAEQGINPFKDLESIEPINELPNQTDNYKPQSTSDIIAGIAKARGGPQWARA